MAESLYYRTKLLDIALDAEKMKQPGILLIDVEETVVQ